MRKSFFLPSLLVFFIAIFFLSDAVAADKKGKVVEVRDGRLERREKDWKELHRGSGVSVGDRLRTDRDALAVFELPDSGRYVMGPDSEIELGKDRKAGLKSGAVWLNAKFPRGAAGAISTTLATAGVRGTKFSVFYGRGTKDVCICTCDGNIEATLKDGRKVQVPGGTILVMKGDAPMPDKAESALPLLEKQAAWAKFCFYCHVEGGRGRLKDSAP